MQINYKIKKESFNTELTHTVREPDKPEPACTDYVTRDPGNLVLIIVVPKVSSYNIITLFLN